MSIINGFVGGIFNFGLIYGSVIYPNKLYIKIYEKQRKSEIMSQNSEMSISRENIETNWTEIINKKIDYLNRFMRYLCRSFCVENMLFLIEIMQFKQEVINKYDGKINDKNVGVLYVLYDLNQDKNDIPKSGIVYNEHNLSINQQILKLYEKYIDENALFQINISYEIRMKIARIVLNEEFDKNDDIQGLVKIFDEGIHEIYLLLHGLFVRFSCDSNYLMELRSDRTDIDQQIVIAMQEQTK